MFFVCYGKVKNQDVLFQNLTAKPVPQAPFFNMLQMHLLGVSVTTSADSYYFLLLFIFSHYYLWILLWLCVCLFLCLFSILYSQLLCIKKDSDHHHRMRHDILTYMNPASVCLALTMSCYGRFIRFYVFSNFCFCSAEHDWPFRKGYHLS